MIFLLLFVLITLIPVSVILISKTLRKKNENGKPTYKPISSSSQINKTYYIYPRGNDTSLQDTLSCTGGMELIESNGLYNIMCGDYENFTYNLSDGLVTLSTQKNINSYFKIFKVGDEYLISTPDEKKFLMFSKNSKKFYMLSIYEASLDMLDTIYLSFELNKRPPPAP